MAYQFVRSSSQRLSTATSPVTTTPLTIAAWIRRSSANTMGVITLRSALTNNAVDWHRITLLSTNVVRAQSLEEATFNSGSSQSTQTVNQNEWTHVAAVFTSTNSRTVYLNGAAAATDTTTVSVAAITQIRIGCFILADGSGSDGGFFDGDIADVGLWNVALTTAEIASLAAGVACNKIRPQSLQFYAPLVRDLVDVRGGRTITNNNSATVANHPRLYL